MTPDELYNKAVKQMNLSYTTGISCIEDATSIKSVRFFRDVTQGEIEGIKEMAREMYLALIYNENNEDKASEHVTYKNFCIRIRKRSIELSNQIRDYASKVITANIVE